MVITFFKPLSHKYGLHDVDLPELVAATDAFLQDSRKLVMYHQNSGDGSFPKLFLQSQSQKTHKNVGDALEKLNARMQDMQIDRLVSKLTVKCAACRRNVYDRTLIKLVAFLPNRKPRQPQHE